MDLKAFVASEVYDVLHHAAKDRLPVRVYSQGAVFDGIPELPSQNTGTALPHEFRGVAGSGDDQAGLTLVSRCNLRLHAYRMEYKGTGQDIPVVDQNLASALHLFAVHVNAVTRLAGPPENTWY